MSPVKRRERRLSRWERLRQDRRAKIGLAVLGGLVLVAVVWTVLSVRATASDLQTAKRQAVVLRQALARGDIDGARRAADRLSDAADSAADRTSGPAWSVLGHTPVLGDDVRGVAVVADTLSDLADDGVQPLVERAGGISAGSYAPRDHVFPIERIAELREPADRAHAAFAEAAERLEGVDTGGFVAPLRSDFDALRDLVVDARSTLDVADRASRLMPDFLGEDEPRDYLFVFQNNAELRATGGLPGALSLVHADGGRVDITRQASSADFRELAAPILPLTKDEQAIYGPTLGTFFLNASFQPDFPRASELWRARWLRQFDERLDGVFVVDPVAVSYLMEATGPITVETKAGPVTLTADAVVRAVENTIYLNVPDIVAQDDFFKALAKRAFDVFADGQGDQVGMVRALARGVGEGRIKLHSFVPGEQDVVAGTRIASELADRPTSRPHVGVYLNDGTGAKMSYYLDYRADVSSTSCQGDRQRLTGRFRVTSDTPRDVGSLPVSVTGVPDLILASRPGDQVLLADLVAPVGGSIDSVSYNGRRQDDPLLDRLHGRQLLRVSLDLQPQETLTVDWSMTTGPGQPGPVDVEVTPGSHAGSESSVAPSTC